MAALFFIMFITKEIPHLKDSMDKIERTISHKVSEHFNHRDEYMRTDEKQTGRKTMTQSNNAKLPKAAPYKVRDHVKLVDGYMRNVEKQTGRKTMTQSNNAKLPKAAPHKVRDHVKLVDGYMRNVEKQTSRKKITLKQLVHSMSIIDSQRFILFSYGIPMQKKGIKCSINGKAVPTIRLAPNSFECHASVRSITNRDKLSLQTRSHTIFPPITKWKDRFRMKNFGYSNLSLCIVTMVKDEEERIEQWLQYHLKQGVEAFIIYDNNCSDNTVSVIKKYKQVIVIDWPWHKTQQESFTHGILYTRGACKWSLFIDVDEYVFPAAQDQNLTVQGMISGFPNWIRNKTLLPENAEKVHQLCFDYKHMGTSNYIKCSNLPIPEAYINRGTIKTKLGKCAIRPDQVSKFKPGVHYFRVKGETFYVPHEYSLLVHYPSQCWEYYITKYKKGRAAYNVPDLDIRLLNESRPGHLWRRKPGPVDTAFRDYYRKVVKWPLPKLNPRRGRNTHSRQISK